MKVFIFLTILVVFTGTTLFAGGQKEEPQESVPAMAPAGSMVMENTMTMTAGDTSMAQGPFIPYRDPAQTMMLAEGKPTVLFFNASWCPDCRAAREDFTARADELTGVNLILVDYDNSDELQARYGVTYQHTFVQIDSNGNVLATWNGGSTDELLDHLRKEEM